MGKTNETLNHIRTNLVTVIARLCYIEAMFDRVRHIALNVGTLLSQPTCQRSMHNPERPLYAAQVLPRY